MIVITCISTAQSRKEIEKRCSTATFIKTTAYHRARTLLNENGHVTIIGKPGSGKSCLSYHLLHDVCNADGQHKDVVIIESAMAVRDILEERDNVAVLVEDVFGKFELSRNPLREWTSVARRVSQNVGPQSDPRHNCLVINVRKNIYDQSSERIPLFWRDIAIDLDNILLSDDEKKRMIKIYAATVTDVDVDRILKITTPVIGFPQCCVVLSECLRTIGNNKTLDIFLNSIYPLKDELRRLQDELPLKFISLALVFIHGENIKNQCSTTNPICKFLIKRYYSLDDIADITDEDMENALYSCSPFYIFLKDDVYRFSHNSIQDSVASCLWEDAQKFVIEKLPCDIFKANFSIRFIGLRNQT